MRKEVDGEWVRLTDERPRAGNGAHYVDGVFEQHVYAGEGCDVVGCQALTDQTVMLLEYTQTGTQPPPDDVEGTFPDEIPVIETSVVPWRWGIQVTYYTDARCSGPARTTMIQANIE